MDSTPGHSVILTLMSLLKLYLKVLLNIPQHANLFLINDPVAYRNCESALTLKVLAIMYPLRCLQPRYISC